MLRTSVTKLKRACSVSHIPRILWGDVWCPASNFEKLSAILMTKYKSTTSSSNDDEDKKDKKRKHLIELAFGPDKLDATERIEKIDVRKIDEIESMVSPDVGNKIDAERKMELNAVPIVGVDGNMQHEDAKSKKCKQLIELVFGPEKSENLVDSNNVSKLPELETEHLAQMVTPGRNRFGNEGSSQEIDSNQANLQNVLNATKVEDEEKLVQKIEKIEESPLVEADINNKSHFMYTHKHAGSKGRHIKDNRTMLEELAKRCVDTSSDKIDSKVMKDMKRLGISQPLLEDLPTDNSEKAQKINLKPKEALRDKENIKIGRRHTGNRRTMKNLAMRMGSDNISEVKISKKELPTEERNCRAEREILIDREESPNLTGTVAVKAVENEIEKLNTERTQFEHQSLIKSSEDYDNSPVTLNVEKEMPTNIDTKNESIVTSKENISTTDVQKPVVLVKDHDDPHGFRITPHTPKAETLASRLNKLNSQVQHSTFITGSSQQVQLEDQEKEQTTFTKEAESSKLTKEIEKIFIDERIPRHLFAELTVITKNLPTDTEIGKTLKAFFDQELEEDATLIKPDRLQYYSHNDEILHFRDCSQEVDPHVVIREYEDHELDPTNTDTTDPYSNYHSSPYYYNNQGNMNQNNMSSDNSGMNQNMTHYNKIMTNTLTSSYDNTWDSVTTGFNKVSSENSNITNKYDLDRLSSINNPNQVLIDPYGKNMKADEWEELEDSNPNSTKKNEEAHYFDTSIDPIFTSRFVVNDGTLVSGNELMSDYKDSKVNRMIQQKRASGKMMYPWIDKGTITTSSVNCNAYIDVQEPVTNTETVTEAPIITKEKEKNMSLTEMLKKVRERARLEAYKQEVLIAAPVTEVDPAEGACKDPKPPCPPPQKTCPPSPPKCPPSNCPEPKPPCPKPCKPACPDPCSTPKCPPAPKKDPCAKFVNQKTVDIMGLVVTLGTLSIPQDATSKHSIRYLEKDNVMPLFVEDILLKLSAITDIVLMPEFNKKLIEREKEIYVPDALLDRSFYFPKDFEPWSPIPSWPIPSKRLQKKLVCPKDGCKVPPPPPPGARCKNIHHPCAGFPNDKKKT